MSESLYRDIQSEEVSKLLEARGQDKVGALDKAVELLDSLVTTPTFTEFLTIPGYRYLD